MLLIFNYRVVFAIAVLVIETPPRYFAKEMAKADETKILRIMVSRSEVSLHFGWCDNFSSRMKCNNCFQSL